MPAAEPFLIVLGVDPGLKHFGWARVGFYLDPAGEGAGWREGLLDMGVIRTEKAKEADRLRVSTDQIGRAGRLGRLLHQRAGIFHVVATEAISLPQGKVQACMICLSFGTVAMLPVLAEARGTPLIVPDVLDVTPQNIKKVLTGKSTASKAEVLEAMNLKPGYRQLKRTLANNMRQTLWEHPVDAVAVVYTIARQPTLQGVLNGLVRAYNQRVG